MWLALPNDVDCDASGLCFTTFKLDQGPRLNHIGRLCVLLHRLGLRQAKVLLENTQ